MLSVAVAQHGCLPFDGDHRIPWPFERTQANGVTKPARQPILVCAGDERLVIQKAEPGAFCVHDFAESGRMLAGAILGPALFSADVLAHGGLRDPFLVRRFFRSACCAISSQIFRRCRRWQESWTGSSAANRACQSSMGSSGFRKNG